MEEKILLIYHKEDNDGLFSAAIIYDYLINSLNVNSKNIDLFPADYNILQEFNQRTNIEYLQENYNKIIMTDISFDWKVMKQIYLAYNNNFIWCDHHAPIIHLSEVNNFDTINGIRDTHRSAILCVWKYLYDVFDEEYNKKVKSKVPELFRILSAWDSFTFKEAGYELDYVRNINKGVTIHYNLDFDKIADLVHHIVETYLNDQPSGIFSALFKDKGIIEDMLKYGKQLNEYDDIVMENIIETSGDLEWKLQFDDEDRGRPLYHKACAIFHQGQTNSLMFKCLTKKHKDIEHGIVFKHQSNGNWVVSLYNIDENNWVHCGDYLREKYNGGGHKGAAGCTLTEEQFIKILKSKIL